MLHCGLDSSLVTMLLVQVTVPQHRLTPLKNSWMSLYTPVTENMKLDMRMNLKAKKVCAASSVPLSTAFATYDHPQGSCLSAHAIQAV